MHSRVSFFLTALLISTGPSAALAKSDQAAPHFTLQVASFPDTAQANRFAVGLVNAGENPVFDTVEIEGRGYWTRVLVGFFDTTDAARRYGSTLVGRGIIKEFLVKKAGLNLAATRPRRVTNSGRAVSPKVLRDSVSPLLPVVEAAAFRLGPRVDTRLIPRPDPVSLAFRLAAGEGQNVSGTPGHRGGLWVSGDTAKGLEHLRWIAGEENVGLIKLDADGRVNLDKRLLAKAAGLRETRVEDPLRALDYISSNEGLLLLVEVTQGRYRYLLHIGPQAPTSGKSVQTAGSLNLDNNIDSRINPYRKNGRKLDGERPPEGFDSLIGLNPVARWFNLRTNCWVQAGEIVFHEIAEAYAKLELGLDYLDHGFRPGAHAIALERELRLKSQRPGAYIVMTAGSNRLLRTEEEIRLFYSEAAAGVSQQ